jgi:hypothetical protein
LLLSGSIRHELRPALGPDNAASYGRIRCRSGQTLLSNASNRRCDRETVPAGPFFSTDGLGNPLDRARPHPQSAAASAGRGCPQSQISIDHSCCLRSRSSGAFRRRPGRGNLRAFMRPPSETLHGCRHFQQKRPGPQLRDERKCISCQRLGQHLTMMGLLRLSSTNRSFSACA